MASGSAANRNSYTARIERIVEHTPDTRSLILTLPEATRFDFVPGQFISLAISQGGAGFVRPYSLASSPAAVPHLEILFNLVPGGAGSGYLFKCAVGDELTFAGPFGFFTLAAPPAVETVFIASTTAIAPIRPMLERALSQPGAARLELLYASPTSAELIYHPEFESWARHHPRFSYRPTLSSAAALTELAHGRYVAGDANRQRQFFICGVGQQVIVLRDLLRAAGYPRRAVQYERW